MSLSGPYRPTSLVYLPQLHFCLRCRNAFTRHDDFEPRRKRVPKAAARRSERAFDHRAELVVGRSARCVAAMSPRCATASMMRGQIGSVTPSSPSASHAGAGGDQPADVSRPSASTKHARSRWRARLHDAHEVRQHDRVGLRVRRPADAHDRLADGVVDGEAGLPDGIAGEQRSQRERRRGPARSAPSPSAISSRRPQRRQLGDRVGERRVERLDRVRERVHRARRQVRHRLRRPSAPGRRSRARAARAGTRRRPPACGGRASSRRRRAWSGPPPPRRPSAPPIAFAASITRPPPSATSGRPSTRVAHGRRRLRHPPAGTSSTTSRSLDQRRRRALPRARVVSSA